MNDVSRIDMAKAMQRFAYTLRDFVRWAAMMQAPCGAASPCRALQSTTGGY
jgi:hypothetical protein